MIVNPPLMERLDEWSRRSSKRFMQIRKLRNIDHEADLHRLDHYGHLLHFCVGHWLSVEAVRENDHGLFSVRALDSSVDYWSRFHFGESRSAGSDRYGRIRREVRNRNQSFLLDWSNSGDGLHWRLHDAFLLRLACPLG